MEQTLLKALNTENKKDCFQGVLQDFLNTMKEYWNTRNIPDILFYLPERSGGMDSLVPVSNDKIVEMELQHQEGEKAEEENTYFHFVMNNEGIQYPDSPDDALILLSYQI